MVSFLHIPPWVSIGGPPKADALNSPNWSKLSDLWGVQITQNSGREADKISFKICHQWTKLKAFSDFWWTAHDWGGCLWTKVTKFGKAFTFAQLNWGQWRLNSKSLASVQKKGSTSLFLGEKILKKAWHQMKLKNYQKKSGYITQVHGGVYNI